MKDFTSVGRRLRHQRFTAFTFLATAAIILACGVAIFLDHGPPTSWRRDPVTHESTNVLLSPEDPAYQGVLRMRWHELMYPSFWAGGFAILGLLAYAASRKAPAKEVLHLAQARQGVLTLPEISTAFDIDPQLAAKALSQLQKLKIAVPRWQEYRKNIWEFPDYMDLPIAPSPDLLHDDGTLVGSSLPASLKREPAGQALNTLSETGIAPKDPSASSTEMVATPQ